MIEAERDVLKEMRARARVPGRGAAARSSANWTSTSPACGRGFGSDTWRACSPPSSSPVIPNASTRGCRCSSPPPPRASGARAGDVRGAGRAAGPGPGIARSRGAARGRGRARAVRAHAGAAARRRGELPDCRIWACAAAVQAHGADWGAVSERLEGVMSTPQFLREVGGRAARRHMRRAWLVVCLAVAGCGAPAPTCSRSSARAPTQRQPDPARVRRRQRHLQRAASTRSPASCCSRPASSRASLSEQAELNLALPARAEPGALLPRPAGRGRGRVCGHLAPAAAVVQRADRVHRRTSARTSAGISRR